jgi:hypothetical protein
LTVARRNNLRAGVTGMLVHIEGSFLQVLEGRPDAVTTIYERIQRDARHHRLLRLFNTPKTERSFAQWTMGFVEPSPSDIPLLGFNDFFRSGLANAHFSASDADKVRDLAHQFRLGRWRQQVSAA